MFVVNNFKLNMIVHDNNTRKQKYDDVIFQSNCCKCNNCEIQ